MKLNKKIYIITGISLAIILIAIGAYFILIKKSQSQIIITEADKVALEKAEQKKLYTDYQEKMAIVYAKNIEDCAKLDSVKRINECFSDIAISSQKKDYCQKITNEKLRAECSNSIDYIVASWGTDPNMCDSLVGDVHKNNCYQEYFVKLESLSNCDKVRNEIRKTQCYDAVNNRLATVFNQPEACNLITDQVLKGNCQKNKFIPPLDTDKDNLPDDVEMSYGTDPFKADTDGDGISDYDEINKFHTNPLNALK